jgi:hypothetical protein
MFIVINIIISISTCYKTVERFLKLVPFSVFWYVGSPCGRMSMEELVERVRGFTAE